ncbi:MAG: choice-of-anchor tandem repeat GloVer-containing protein [Candidatus Korobacteraceae bacterium]
MHRAIEFSNPLTVPTPQFRAAVIAIAVVLALSLLPAQPAQAQTLTVLHTFTGGQDGGYPEAGMTMDREGNLYGTTYDSSPPHYDGNVFKMTRSGSSWVLTPLYTFDGTHGAYPQARVVFGPDGALYGTTAAGGQSGCYYEGAGCGVVFKLQPPAAACHSALCPWTQTVIHYFTDDPDGAAPGFGDVIFDPQGRLYGTTWRGGSGYERGGTLYQLTPSNGYWTASILHNFGDESGSWPLGGTSFDATGNLYGTTWFGGTGDGVVYQMMPSGSGWQYNVIHQFDGTDGNSAKAALFRDAAGNFYSTTEGGGADGVGVVFQMTSSGGGWTYNVIYNFLGTQFYDGPLSTLISDAQGNLYGDTLDGGIYGNGSVFKLTPTAGGWTYTSLHDFNCNGPEGCGIFGPLVMDAEGNIYGTSNGGGVANCGNGYACGTVWEITP